MLGRGATGIVYAAKDLRTKQRVAIKVLQRHGGFEPRSPDLLRFEQEARIAGALDSPHVVRLLDVDLAPRAGAPYFVMELLRGEDLQSLLDRVGPLPTAVALGIAAQAAAGLVSAHAAGVVHRDIKPSNLFLARREGGNVTVKIIDFGVAKIRRLPVDLAQSGALMAPGTTMTESGQLLGSPLYMSPEQVDARKDIDARSDVFSLGITLFAMLAGKPPHAEVKGFAELLARVSNDPAPSIGRVVPDVENAVADLIQRATSLERENRFSGMAEMLEAMTPLLFEGSALREDMLVGRADAPPPTAPTPVECHREPQTTDPRSETRHPRAKNGSSNRMIVTIAVVAVVAVLVAVVIMMR